MESCIRVLIADDHAIVREGLRAVIGIEPDLELVAEAVDGVDAVQKACEFQPDVIVMDLLMPNKDGVEATGDILRDNPNARILVLTSFTDDAKIIPAVRSGALGYIVKNSPPQELLSAIREVARGAVVLPPALVRHLFHRYNGATDLGPPREQTLTFRELEILKLVARGLSNEDIAERLIISSRTVGVHISHLLDKLQMDNRTQLALFALRRGLVGLFED